MTTMDLLARFAALSVTFQANGDRLRVLAPPGTLTEADWTAIADNKRAILLTLPENGRNGRNGRTAGSETSTPMEPVQAIAVVRRLWPVLLGLLPIRPGLAVMDLGTSTGEPDIDADAAELRQALLALAGVSTWPTTASSIDGAFARLVAGGVLVRDASGRLSPTTGDGF